MKAYVLTIKIINECKLLANMCVIYCLIKYVWNYSVRMNGIMRALNIYKTVMTCL